MYNVCIGLVTLKKNTSLFGLKVRSGKSFLIPGGSLDNNSGGNDQELKRRILYNKYKPFSHNLTEHLTFSNNNYSLG